MGASATNYNSGSDLDEKRLNLLGKPLMYADRQIDSRYKYVGTEHEKFKHDLDGRSYIKFALQLVLRARSVAILFTARTNSWGGHKH